jgi:hypothetical protein
MHKINFLSPSDVLSGPNKSACTLLFGSVHCGRGDKSSGAVFPDLAA